MSGEGAYQLGEMVTGCKNPVCELREYCQALHAMVANSGGNTFVTVASDRDFPGAVSCPHTDFILQVTKETDV